MSATAARTHALRSLVTTIPRTRVQGDEMVPVSGISYDSRTVEPGDLFVALTGADADGHDYAADAVSRGAVALLTERPLGLCVPEVVVLDSRAALAQAAAAFWGHPSNDVGVIGVTGTDGKTTTSFLIDAILRSAGLRTGLIGTIAVRIGDDLDTHGTRQTTPESADIQRFLRATVDVGASWATLEATSHGLAMHRLDGVAVRIGAVTNITREHLDFHGTVENYIRAKGLLFSRVAESGGVAVINRDDPGAVAMTSYAAGARTVGYSIDGHPAELRASDVRSDSRGSRFVLETDDWGAATFRLPLIGRFNVANALCAIGVALAAGLDLSTIADGLSTVPPVPGRMALVDAGQLFSVVVDYAHTPDALEKVLTLLRDLHPTGRLIALFGSAGERDVEKRPLQGAVAVRLADFSVFTTEDPRHEDPEEIIDQIARGAINTGALEGERFCRVTDRAAAVRRALAQATKGDCVLLAGKGHEGSIIWGREKRPWDEAAMARSALAELGYGAAP